MIRTSAFVSFIALAACNRADDSTRPRSSALASTASSSTAHAPTARHSTPHPAEPRSAERICGRDEDCALVPDDCMNCPPCDAAWRKAANKKRVSQIRAERARFSCPPITCPECPRMPPEPGAAAAPVEEGFIGDRAVCVKGQCSVE